MEAPHSSNPIAQIWKYLLVQVVLVLPFPRNPFAAAMYIQTRDCGIACENSYCLCNNHKEKRRGRFIQKIFFQQRRKNFSHWRERKNAQPRATVCSSPALQGGVVGLATRSPDLSSPWRRLLNSDLHVLRFLWGSWIFHLEKDTLKIWQGKKRILYFIP